tara:strand:+ start:1220 stop:1963 length:744 start_codon:yes stop_codon:yes gene_type:complete
MTTEGLVGDTTVSNEAQSVDQTVSAPEAPVEISQTSSAEKMLPQSEVNRLVAGIKKESYEKGLTASQQPSGEQSPTSANSNASSQSVQDIVQAELKKANDAHIAQAQEQQQKADLNQLVSELKPKLDAASAKYEDFNEKLSPEAMSEVLQVNPALLVYANQVDNSGDVLYEIMKHPEKLAMLNNLSSIPSQAVNYVKGLAKSISSRDAAKTAPQQPQPLSTIKPSTVGAVDGPMTVADYSKLYKGTC